MELRVDDITHVIQLSVAPVFLLTSIATMINAMNTRLSRIVDRRRVVIERRKSSDQGQNTESDLELTTLSRRSYLSYLGILFAVLSALLICLVMIGAFIGAEAFDGRHPRRRIGVEADGQQAFQPGFAGLGALGVTMLQGGFADVGAGVAV